MKAAAAVAAEQPSPEKMPAAPPPQVEFRNYPQQIGYRVNDYSIDAPEAMTPRDLTNPVVWALAKQNQSGLALATGDSVRVIHRDWFATVLVDQAARNEPCHVVVQSVTQRSTYERAGRDLIPADHDVITDPISGHFKAVFRRVGETIELGEYSVWQAAADQCRDHASRVAPQRRG